MDCVQALHHLGEIVERLELQKAVRETQKKKIQVRIEKNQKGPASKKKKCSESDVHPSTCLRVILLYSRGDTK